jgi:F0F1-type ATP synthase epsilon subunit
MTSRDRNVNVGGDFVGNLGVGDNTKQGDVTVTHAGATAAKQDLLTLLADLRSRVEDIELADRSAALTRIDDLAEEAESSEVDKKGGVKAFARLKTALTGVGAVATLLASIEDQVRKLFS